MPQNSDEKAIVDISKSIFGSLSFSDQKIDATMSLLQTGEDKELLALALQYLLLKAFRLHFPATEMAKVSQGESVHFREEESGGDLALRKVSIIQDDDFPKVTITGIPPKHGRNSFSKLHFQWKKQAAKVDNLGNANLKSLNSFPTVQEDELLATIYLNTAGTPGVNALGKVLKAVPGKALSVKIHEDSIRREDDASDTSQFLLYSKRSGIANFKFLQAENPKTLFQLAVTDTITINGDIDYSVGDLSDDDLGCGAINIVVNGDVRGAFSLKSRGFIVVKGTVEGQKVIAKNIQANVITSGTQATAKDQIVVDTLIKAKANAKVVTLKKASNDSILIGSEQVTLDKGANCLALDIRTRELVVEAASFSGRTIVNLGQDIFDREDKILKEHDFFTKALAKSTPEIQELGESALFNLRQLKVFIVQGVPSAKGKCREQLDEIQEKLETLLNEMNKPMEAGLINQCYSLSNNIDDKQAAEEVTAKIETLITPLQKLNKALKLRCQMVEKVEATDGLIEGLRQEVEMLSAQFNEPKFVTNASEVVIKCGRQTLPLSSSTLPEPTFQVCYQLDSQTGISDGSLVFEESF